MAIAARLIGTFCRHWDASPSADSVRLISRLSTSSCSTPVTDVDRSIPKVEHQVWTPGQLRTFLRAAAGHRLFSAFWLAAATGMRRSELLGLRWSDIDLARGNMSINRGLIAVAYELHETRGKTRNARRSIDLDPTTVEVLVAWRHWQRTEQAAAEIDIAGWVFTDPAGQPIHPHAISQAFERASTGRPRPGEDAVEGPGEDRRTTVEALADLAIYQGLLVAGAVWSVRT
jgi:integrase